MPPLQRIPQTRTGFTLMEIMVVIIVIAVLASVAGPMIGSITDQGKSSATKASMNNLKTALVNYNNDLGRFPHIANAYNSSNINSADTAALLNQSNQNVLVENSVGGSFSNMGINAYGKRWKGPYMDSDATAFMQDAWDLKIKYFHYNKQIWLQSGGPDGQFNNANDVTVTGYSGDDLITSLSRVKF